MYQVIYHYITRCTNQYLGRHGLRHSHNLAGFSGGRNLAATAYTSTIKATTLGITAVTLSTTATTSVPVSRP